MSKLKSQSKVAHPEEVVMLETELGIKFHGPYSDGREWDGILPAKNSVDYMIKLGELGKWFQEKGFTKESKDLHSTLAIKLKKNVHVGIDVAEKGWQITVYYDA